MDLVSAIPEYLLRQHSVLPVYCYLIRAVRNCSSTTMVGDKILALRPYEHADTIDIMKQRIGLPEDTISASLQRLLELDLITIRREDALLHIKMNHLVLLPSSSPKQSDSLGYNDCWLQEFIQEEQEWTRTNLEEKTLKNTERVLKLFSKFVGTIKLSQLRLSHIEDYKRMRKEQTLVSATKTRKLSDLTINLDLRTLKAVFERAVRRGRLSENPFRNIDLIRCAKRQKAFFTKDQFAQLYTTIREPWLKKIVAIAVLTCMRLGEIANLLRKDVHFEDGEIIIQSSELYHVKQGGMRKLPMSEEVLRILKSQPGSSQWVFTDDNGRKLRGDHISKKFKSYVRECLLPEELHFHSLRATGGTWMVSANAPIYAVKEIMGHASVKTTEPYASIGGEAMRQALDKIAIPLQVDKVELKLLKEARELVHIVPDGAPVLLPPGTRRGRQDGENRCDNAREKAE